MSHVTETLTYLKTLILCLYQKSLQKMEGPSTNEKEFPVLPSATLQSLQLPLYCSSLKIS